ncbi:hypothetical protein CLCR_05814 [Cladophialophora carrionii]|uniref:Uncharacterized protein n=1 Tax=Cladophialophora carrionii TaxID=86049 RepID=A0A1C1C7Q7_9EURO|nr:hypothetical protein CLCR_05814 [Cladophialophora carrionii]
MLYGHLTVPEQDPNSRDIAPPNEQDAPYPGNGASQAPDLFLDFIYNGSPDEVQENNTYEAPMSWLQAIGPWRRRHPSLDLAMSAILNMVRLEGDSGDERLQREGVAKYGRALKDVQNILASDRLALEELTLASCMILAIFEACHPVLLYACPAANGERIGDGTLGRERLWMGEPCRRYLEAIPASRSSAACRRPEPPSVLGLSTHRRKCVRVSIPPLSLGARTAAHCPSQIIHALALRKPTYLAEPDWLTIPWTRQSKTDFHHLLDIMAQVPIFIDQTERVHKVSPSDMSGGKRWELLEQGWELHRQLKDWYQELTRRVSEPFYIERRCSLSWPDPVPRTDLGNGFPTFLHFQTFQIARMHLFYWTTLLLLYDNILRTMPASLEPTKLDSASASTSLRMTDKAAIRRQALDVATLIARSMEFLLSKERFLGSEEMQIRGLLNTPFPLRTAIHVFASAQQHAMESWCRSVFDGLAQRGYPFGQILCGWHWDDIPVFLAGACPS